MRLEATVGRNELGDVAVDDVRWDAGPCPVRPQTAAAAAAAGQPSAGDCTFEVRALTLWKRRAALHFAR